MCVSPAAQERCQQPAVFLKGWQEEHVHTLLSEMDVFLKKKRKKETGVFRCLMKTQSCVKSPLKCEFCVDDPVYKNVRKNKKATEGFNYGHVDLGIVGAVGRNPGAP